MRIGIFEMIKTENSAASKIFDEESLLFGRLLFKRTTHSKVGAHISNTVA
jgi:hypothetical protein